MWILWIKYVAFFGVTFDSWKLSMFTKKYFQLCLKKRKKLNRICANCNLRRYFCLWAFWQKWEIWDAARGFFFSLWLSATEWHSLPPSPASVGGISFNIPALWGKGRRSSLIGWAEMLPVFRSRQIRGCYWCSCPQCRFLKGALGERHSDVSSIFMAALLKIGRWTFKWMFARHILSAAHVVGVRAPL